jgi:cytochrome c-type biogenesis protein CcmF
LIHLGVIFAAIGIIGMEFYQVETQQNIALGESMTIESPFVGSYEITYEGLEVLPRPNPNIEVVQANLQVNYNGQPVGLIEPTREFFVQQQQPMTIPDTVTQLSNELYIIVAGWEGDGETATFKAYINPLINWLWFGGLVFVFGTLVAGWPEAEASRRRIPVKMGRGVVPAK